MEGNITVKSIANTAPLFTTGFPMKLMSADTPSQPNKDEEKKEKLEESPAIRVLLVEDFAPNVMVATYFLDELKYSYDVASNGEEAVNKYKLGRYNIVIMDVQMPVMDGIQATFLIRKHERDHGLNRVKIIGITAHALAGDKEKCLEAGMDDYLSKPYGFNELIKAINN